MSYLGIDTSNYRTSAALFDAQAGTWEAQGQLLTVPEGGLGLRQSEALFQHTTGLHRVMSALSAPMQLQAVGVSTRPRAVEGSYMPCFLAGENVARSIAHTLAVPVFACSHQQGHIAAAALSADKLCLLHEQFLAWHLSGGTSELVLVTPGDAGLPQAQHIGGSNDLAAGQLIDRTGQRLDIAFPAGAQLDLLAGQAEEDMLVPPFTPKVQDSFFSLSGVENKVQELIAQGYPPQTIARFTLETISKAVCKATQQALKKYALPVLCAGGVMASQLLKQQMQAQFGAFFATPQLSGDNAVGVAVLAAMQHGEAICKTMFIQSPN